MTDDVGALVLRDNYLQSQAISLLQADGARSGSASTRTSSARSSSTALLDRALEYLPSAEEIEDRRRAGQGLTRPELAMLLSYAKIALNNQLIQSDVPEDPYLEQRTRPLLPGPARASATRKLLGEHRLQARDHRHGDDQQHREPHGPDVRRAHPAGHGADAATVARAYSIAREVVRGARPVARRSSGSTTRSPRPCSTRWCRTRSR